MLALSAMWWAVCLKIPELYMYYCLFWVFYWEYCFWWMCFWFRVWSYGMVRLRGNVHSSRMHFQL